MKIEVLRSDPNKSKSKYYWRIVAVNGKILAHSEQYNRKANAVKTAKALKAELQFANIVICEY